MVEAAHIDAKAAIQGLTIAANALTQAESFNFKSSTA